MLKCLNEFEFRPDLTTDYGIICPRASINSPYNLVATLAPSFLILAGNENMLKAWMKLYFSQT